MEKIGILGGSFNPPHLGHVQCGQYALNALGLDEILFLPCSQTPGKAVPFGTPSPAARLEMTRLAVSGLEKCGVRDWDLCRGGETFTCDTVARFRQEYPQGELWLLVGDDQFLIADQWKQMALMAPGLHFGVFTRNPKKSKDVQRQKAVLEEMGAEVKLLDNPLSEISSTQVRRLLAFGAGDSFLPEKTARYILENRLYFTAADWKNLPMEELEPIVLALLNPNRIKHVLGVRDTSVELALRWGTDPVDAGRAGLLHDITKALDGPLQLTLCDAYGKILSDFSRRYPKTLHALTGSLVAQRIFGENEAVVSAICCHTTGKADMNILEKIIYVADYMEPNRDFPGVEKLRELAYTDITAALQLGLEMTLEHLANQGSEVSPESGEALAYLRSPKGKE